MGLRDYIAKRVIYSFILLIFVLTLNYLIFMKMPGDPAELFIPARGLSSQQMTEMKNTFRDAWGLNDPPHIQFLKYLQNMLTFQFGRSLTVNPGRSVATEMLTRIPYTVILMGGSTVFAILIGVILGVIAAYKRGSLFDSFSVSSSLILNSLPTFWMGMIFVLVFTLRLGWFPHAGAAPYEWSINPPHPLTITTSSSGLLATTISINPSEALILISGYLSHAFLPLLTLTLFQYGGYLLLTRATMMEALSEDYIVTAHAKGLDDRTVLFKHALKNASLPLITSAAIAFGFMLSGAIITETVYTWPGLGRWVFQAMQGPDYFVMQAAFYSISLCVIIANFLSDLIYGMVDPRIKFG